MFLSLHKQAAVLAAAVLASATPASAQAPEWIWADNKGAATGDNEVRLFGTAFNIVGKVLKADFTATCDDQMKVFLNGKQIADSDDWKHPVRADVISALKPGENVLTIRRSEER